MGATRKFQIFISSTFEDLEEERRLVMEQVLNARHIPVGMELFQAGNDEQWDFIRRRIDECDYYLVVLAERYGACDSEGMSYTEKEYRYAIANKIPVAALLLSTKAQKDWPAKKSQGEHRDKLAAFKKYCSESKMVKFWDDPKDLALKALHALNGLIEDHPRPGLVPATEAASAATIAELARLSEENNSLRKDLARAESKDETALTKTEQRILRALKKHTIHEALKHNGLNVLGTPKAPKELLIDLFYDIASSGLLAIDNDGMGSYIARRLETPKGIDIAEPTQETAKEIEALKDAVYQLGFAVNDRLAALGLLARSAPNDEGKPTWTISDVGWKIVRHDKSPEDILLNW